jgi:4-hydroxy-tetrahydrodipicolinate reductase
MNTKSNDDLRVVFAGAAGRMGRALIPGITAADGLALVAEVEKGEDLTACARDARADVVVDFTEPASAVANARAILAVPTHGVIGTTGFTPEDLDALDVAARKVGRGLVVAPNFALGMVLLQRFAEEAARHMPAVEIVETHHPAKLDAPSGTSADTARRVAACGGHAPAPGTEASRGLDVDGVRVHSLRLPGIDARQEVHFGGDAESLLLRHDASGRDCYLRGVLAAIRAVGRHVGVVRGLERILFP